MRITGAILVNVYFLGIIENHKIFEKNGHLDRFVNI